MKTKRDLILSTTSALVLPMLWVAGMSDASAFGRPGKPRAAASSVQRTGPANHTLNRQSAVSTNGAGGYQAGSTVTGPAGRAATRQQTGAFDAETKTYNRTGTTTGPSGQQSTFNTSVQATGNGYERNATRTGPNGQSVSSTGGAAVDRATGTVTQGRATTGPNGKTATESRTVTVAAPSQP